jgi:hypothetical protein
MPDVRDPSALMRHAVQAGDWRLVELIARILNGRASRGGRCARSAYSTLCLSLNSPICWVDEAVCRDRWGVVV